MEAGTYNFHTYIVSHIALPITSYVFLSGPTWSGINVPNCSSASRLYSCVCDLLSPTNETTPLNDIPFTYSCISIILPITQSRLSINFLASSLNIIRSLVFSKHLDSLSTILAILLSNPSGVPPPLTLSFE